MHMMKTVMKKKTVGKGLLMLAMGAEHLTMELPMRKKAVRAKRGRCLAINFNFSRKDLSWSRFSGSLIRENSVLTFPMMRTELRIGLTKRGPPLI